MRRLALPAMMVGLGAYVIVHSPVLTAIGAMVGRTWRASYLVPREGILVGAAIDAAVVVTAILAALIAAAVVTRRFEGPPYERPLVYGLLVFGFIAIPAAYVGGLAGWMGTAQLRPPLGPLIVASPALLVVAVGLHDGWRPVLPRPHFEAPGRLVLALGVVAVVLIGLSAALSVTRSPTGFDALSYHAPMAVYFWRDGNIVTLLDRAPWNWALAHPGATELWFGLILTGFGERAANLGQLPFALLGGAAVHAFARRLGFRHRAATIAALAFLIAPIVVIQAGIQLSDVSAAALLMCGVALACAPASSHSRARAAAIGLALGLAVTAKLAVLPGAAAVIGYVMIASMRANWSTPRRVAGVWMGLALAFAVALAPWAARNVARFGNPIYPAALPVVGRGVVVGDFQKNDTLFVPRAAAWPLYPLLEPHSDESGLGPLFLIGAVPGLVAATARRRRRPLALYLAVSVTSIAAWWTLTQHQPRLILAVFGLGFAFLPWALLTVPRRLRAAAGVVLIIAAVFSAIVTLDRALMPRAAEPLERAQFYDRIWNVDPALAAWDAPERLLYNTGYASLSYAGDYPLLGPSLKRVLLTVDASVPAQAIIGLMKRHGVRYAYVPASPRSQELVEAKYTTDVFELKHMSTVTEGKRKGTRRYLFRLKDSVMVRSQPLNVSSAGR